MKKTLLSVSLAAGMLATSMPAMADNMDNPWHFSIFAGRAILDSDRPTDNGDLFYGVGLGRFVNENLSFDLEYDRLSANVDPAAINAIAPGATFNEFNIKAVSLNGRYFFNPEGAASPFVLFGAGFVDNRSIISDNEDFLLNLGAGIDGELTDRVRGRFQAMYRYNHDNNTLFPVDNQFDDFLLTLGISVDLGSRSEPQEVEVAPAKPEADVDSDGDGVIDSRDRCPNTPPGTAVDQYGCSLDSDGDGVPNTRDKCPDSREGAVVGLDGCEVEAVIELKGVNFDFDEATLRPDAIAILDEAAELLNHHTRVVVEVAGHTDSIGSESYNQGLSERRANVVRDYLMGKGINASRMNAKGYGEARPVATNDTSAGRAENRRTELVVLDR